MRLKNISGGYPGKFVLNNINFSIDKGKTYALLGLNGSGKTTLIKMILGILKADTGNVMIENIDIDTLKEKDRAQLISYVPQYSNLAFDTSALDLVLMGVTPYLKMFQTPTRRHVEQAYRWLGELGIGNLAETNYQQLSGGQQQLVIIARSLLQNGKYMILDEPESNLDLLNKNMIMKKINQISKTYNKGCLISMHNPEYALNYCENIILLKDGKVLEVDVLNSHIEDIESKLSMVYGNIKLIQYKQKLFIDYN